VRRHHSASAVLARHDDLVIRPRDCSDASTALDSVGAKRLRDKLGDDAFFAICDVFRTAYDRGTIVDKRDLLDIVRTQERYAYCLELEQFVFAEYAARRR